MGIPYCKADLFRYYSVSRQQGYKILAEPDLDNDRRHLNNPSVPERRGRPTQLSPKQLRQCDSFLQDAGWDARVLTWDQCATEIDLGVSGRTLQRHLGSLDCQKCIVYSKGWVSKRNADARKDYSTTYLGMKPELEDWYNVRFSDEVHWRIGPQRKMRITRKPGEGYCGD